MYQARHRIFLLTIGALIALMGAAFTAGGGWLIALGGSWYYLVAGLGLLLVSYLLIGGRAAALAAYAVIVAGTLAWAWWEVGLDWWPMAARGDVIFLVGLLLLTPWVTRALGHRDARRVSALRGAGLSLTVVLAVALATALASWFNDPHRLQGTLPVARTDTPTDRSGIPPGEWHAYGRTCFGQRYSPLAQITPAQRGAA